MSVVDELGLSPEDYADEDGDGDGFDAATAAVVSLSAAGALARDAQLCFYGLYKQATAGDAPASAPASLGVFRGAAGLKWAAWDARRGMDAGAARRAYVEMLRARGDAGPAAADGEASGAADAVFGGFGGRVFSRPSGDGDGGAHAGTSGRGELHDAVMDGDIAAVRAMLARAPVDTFVDCRDGDGASALMLAADRDDTAILVALLEHGASVDCVDDAGMARRAGPAGGARESARVAPSDPVVVRGRARHDRDALRRVLRERRGRASAPGTRRRRRSAGPRRTDGERADAGGVRGMTVIVHDLTGCTAARVSRTSSYRRRNRRRRRRRRRRGGAKRAAAEGARTTRASRRRRRPT